MNKKIAFIGVVLVLLLALMTTVTAQTSDRSVCVHLYYKGDLDDAKNAQSIAIMRGVFENDFPLLHLDLKPFNVDAGNRDAAEELRKFRMRHARTTRGFPDPVAIVGGGTVLFEGKREIQSGFKAKIGRLAADGVFPVACPYIPTAVHETPSTAYASPIEGMCYSPNDCRGQALSSDCKQWRCVKRKGVVGLGECREGNLPKGTACSGGTCSKGVCEQKTSEEFAEMEERERRLENQKERAKYFAFYCSGDTRAKTGPKGMRVYGLEKLNYTWDWDEIKKYNEDAGAHFCEEYFCDATQFTLNAKWGMDEEDPKIKKVFEERKALCTEPGVICVKEDGSLRLSDLYPLFKDSDRFMPGVRLYLTEEHTREGKIVKPLEIHPKKEPCVEKGMDLHNQVLSALEDAKGGSYGELEKVFDKFAVILSSDECYGVEVDESNVFLEVDSEGIEGKKLLKDFFNNYTYLCAGCSSDSHYIAFGTYKELHTQILEKLDKSTGECSGGRCTFTKDGVTISGTAREWTQLFEILYRGKFKVFYIMKDGLGEETKEIIIKEAKNYNAGTDENPVIVDLRPREYYLIGDNVSDYFMQDFVKEYAGAFGEDVTAFQLNYYVEQRKVARSDSAYKALWFSEEEPEEGEGWELLTSGEYLVRYDPTVNSNGNELDVGTKNVFVGQLRTLEEIDSGSGGKKDYSANALLYLPFNGLVGKDSDTEVGEREDYGLVLKKEAPEGEDNVLRFTPPAGPFQIAHIYEGALDARGLAASSSISYPWNGDKVIELTTREKARYFDSRDGGVASIRFFGDTGYFSFIPSSPLALELESPANNRIYYRFADKANNPILLGHYMSILDLKDASGRPIGTPVEYLQEWNSLDQGEKYLLKWINSQSVLVEDLLAATVNDSVYEISSRCRNALGDKPFAEFVTAPEDLVRAESLKSITYIPITSTKEPHKLQVACADEKVKITGKAWGGPGEEPKESATEETKGMSGNQLFLIPEGSVFEKPLASLNEVIASVETTEICIKASEKDGTVLTKFIWNGQELLEDLEMISVNGFMGDTCEEDNDCKSRLCRQGELDARYCRPIGVVQKGSRCVDSKNCHEGACLADDGKIIPYDGTKGICGDKLKADGPDGPDECFRGADCETGVCADEVGAVDLMAGFCSEKLRDGVICTDDRGTECLSGTCTPPLGPESWSQEHPKRCGGLHPQLHEEEDPGERVEVTEGGEKLGPGESCTKSDECESGACKKHMYELEDDVGVCSKKLGRAPCETGDECESGSCQGTGTTKHCAPGSRGLLSICNEDHPCATGYRCDLKTSLCVEGGIIETGGQAGEGDPCSEQLECGEGYYCRGTAGPGRGVCAAELDDGTPCAEDAACDSGVCAGEEGSMECIPSERLELESGLSPGDECALNEQCNSGKCEDGTCALRPRAGSWRAECTLISECDSRTCLGGVGDKKYCAADTVKESGEECINSVECEVGSACVKDTGAADKEVVPYDRTVGVCHSPAIRERGKCYRNDDCAGSNICGDLYGTAAVFLEEGGNCQAPLGPGAFCRTPVDCASGLCYKDMGEDVGNCVEAGESEGDDSGEGSGETRLAGAGESCTWDSECASTLCLSGQCNDEVESTGPFAMNSRNPRDSCTSSAECRRGICSERQVCLGQMGAPCRGQSDCEGDCRTFIGDGMFCGYNRIISTHGDCATSEDCVIGLACLQEPEGDELYGAVVPYSGDTLGTCQTALPYGKRCYKNEDCYGATARDSGLCALNGHAVNLSPGYCTEAKIALGNNCFDNSDCVEGTCQGASLDGDVAGTCTRTVVASG